MEEFRTRPFADDDAAAVADLLNAAEVAHGGEPGSTPGEIRGYAGMLLGDGKGDSRLYVTDDGALAAVAFIGLPPPGGSKADLIGGVAPELEGRGLGRTLLTWQLERVAALRATLQPDAEWHAETGDRIRERRRDPPHGAGRWQRGAIRLPDGGAGRAMSRRSTSPRGSASCRIRSRLVPRCTPRTPRRSATTGAYQGRPFDNWAPGTIHSDVFRGDLSRIALDGDQIAAYILAYDGVEGSVYIGQVGTRRPWRKRGLASALLSDSVRAAAAAGSRSASLGVDADSPTGAVGVYERLGFQIRHKVVVFHWTVA